MKPTKHTQMMVQLPSGNTQLIKPDMAHFDGNWQALAEAIFGHKPEKNYTVIYKLL